jgi:hypothetical protein
MRTTPDPHLAELLHRVTAEGWGNDSVGDLDQDGFHASLLIVEPAEQQELKRGRSTGLSRRVTGSSLRTNTASSSRPRAERQQRPATLTALAPTGFLPQPRGSTGHAHPHR